MPECAHARIPRKGTSATQIAVMSGDVVIASLYKGVLSVTADQAVVWNWSFKTTEGPPGFQQHGTATSFEEPKRRSNSDGRSGSTRPGCGRSSDHRRPGGAQS